MRYLLWPKFFFNTTQVKRLERRDTVGQAKFVESLFGIAA